MNFTLLLLSIGGLALENALKKANNLLIWLIPLFLLLPCIVWGWAVAVRRCHDLGFSGVLVLLVAVVGIIPMVGWGASTILWICLGFMDGQPFTNQYGPDPKGRNYIDPRAWPAQAFQQQRPENAQVLNSNGSVAKVGDLLRELKKLQDDLTASMIDIPGRGFAMCKYEVTQTLWETVMGKNPSCFKGADNPVEQISWNDCQEFLTLLNALPAVKASGLVFRLPTEEEWEYACRAGATGKYCKLADGTEITEDTLGRVAWFDHNADMTTHPVGQKEPNAFGLYDMHGNVCEWTQTADGALRVSRGGSWFDSVGNCESSRRFRLSPDYQHFHLGFRLCASGRTD